MQTHTKRTLDKSVVLTCTGCGPHAICCNASAQPFSDSGLSQPWRSSCKLDTPRPPSPAVGCLVFPEMQNSERRLVNVHYDVCKRTDCLCKRTNVTLIVPQIILSGLLSVSGCPTPIHAICLLSQQQNQPGKLVKFIQ